MDAHNFRVISKLGVYLLLGRVDSFLGRGKPRPAHIMETQEAIFLKNAIANVGGSVRVGGDIQHRVVFNALSRRGYECHLISRDATKAVPALLESNPQIANL